MLANPIGLSDGTTLASGAEIVGVVDRQEASDTPEDPGTIVIRLTSLQKSPDSIVVLNTSRVSLRVEKQSSAGKVAKYSVLGAIIGGAGAALLKSNPLVGVAVGAAAGGAAGAVAASATDACIQGAQTTIPFILTKTALVP
jgi:uncharacterized membrane protein